MKGRVLDGSKVVAGGALLLVIACSFAGYLALPRESLAASYSTSLGGRSFSQRHNALLALRELDGAVIKAGEEFSFNRRVGTFSRDQGYRKAPVSYNGQLIDDWGGGVCQASTTLYNAALLSGLRIVERNRHRFCPSYVPPGRDAAVAFSNIDLRFVNPYDFPLRVHAFIDHDKARVDIYSARPLQVHPEVLQSVVHREPPATFYLGSRSSSRRVRNSGKAGMEVVVYRMMGSSREIISCDDYPVMNRVVDFSP